MRQDSPLRANEEVDRAGLRVAVGKGSAYDLYLTRELKAAEIVRAPTSPAVVDTFLEQSWTWPPACQQLEADAARHAGLRLLPGRFMVIRQAMGCPKGYPAEAQRHLADFVERMKAGGFVADALARHGIQGASVAPAAVDRNRRAPDLGLQAWPPRCAGRCCARWLQHAPALVRVGHGGVAADARFMSRSISSAVMRTEITFWSNGG